MTRLALRVAIAVTSAAVLVGAAPAAGSRETTIRFAFRGHANNVRVRAPLVGPWQLGTANIRGSGTLAASLDGTFFVANDPLYSRYPPHSIRGTVVGFSYFRAPHDAYTKLRLTVDIAASSTSAGDCPVGARGVLTLYESAQRLGNGERSDYVTLHWPRSARCLAHEQGWTNEDGGARTQPSFGGPPRGGQWAIVAIR